ESCCQVFNTLLVAPNLTERHNVQAMSDGEAAKCCEPVFRGLGSVTAQADHERVALPRVRGISRCRETKVGYNSAGLCEAQTFGVTPESDIRNPTSGAVDCQGHAGMIFAAYRPRSADDNTASQSR